MKIIVSPGFHSGEFEVLVIDEHRKCLPRARKEACRSPVQAVRWANKVIKQYGKAEKIARGRLYEGVKDD